MHGRVFPLPPRLSHALVGLSSDKTLTVNGWGETALPYLLAFHGNTIVVRLGGEAMADPALKAGFARDVSLLQLVGMKIIVVHGGGWGIDALMRTVGL